jgi:hypothetical protein
MAFKFDFVSRPLPKYSCNSMLRCFSTYLLQDIPEEDLENLGLIKPTRDTSSQGSLTPPASEHNQLAGNDLEKHVSQLGISSPPDIKIHPSDTTTHEIPLSELVRTVFVTFCTSVQKDFQVNTAKLTLYAPTT